MAVSNKTQATAESVSKFIQSVADPARREDRRAVCELMAEITGREPVMRRSSIVGFGRYHYKYSSSRDGQFLLTGFSPRKQNLTLYIMPGFSAFNSLLEKLGPHKTGKSCLYVRRLADVDIGVLTTLIGESVKYMEANYAVDTVD